LKRYDKTMGKRAPRFPFKCCANASNANTSNFTPICRCS